MQLSPRPTRIPLTCPCGARLSVIPRLQGTEVKCPRCQESLPVPGDPIETSTVVVTPEPAESIPSMVAAKRVQESSPRDIAASREGDDSVQPQTVLERPRSIGLPPFKGTLVSSSDSDSVGRDLQVDLVKIGLILSDFVPKTVRTIMEECGDPNTAIHIAELVREGKVQAWAMDGGGVGYTISEDWMKSVRSGLPPNPVSGGNETQPEATDPLNPPANRDLIPPLDRTTQQRRQEFRPIGLTSPTRKRGPTQPVRSLFPAPMESGSDSKPENARSVPVSIEQSDLTSSQKKVFDAVERSFALKGISPSIQELQTATSLTRFDTINEVDALVRKGLFEFDRSSVRGIRIIPEADRVLVNGSIVSVTAHPAELERVVPQEPTAGQETKVDEKTDTSGGTGVVLSQKESSAVAIPKWVDWLFDSELLNQRFEAAGRRVPPREQVRAFLSLLVREGAFASRETVCSSLVLPPIRYEGFIAVVMRIMNVDNVPILTKTEGGDGVRLNISLLHHQFEIPK